MKKVIGRRERISFPEWDIYNVVSKIDTGAFTSSIHCDFVEVRKASGRDTLFFRVLDKSHKKYNGRVLKTDHFEEKKVKNSFGQEEVRYKISTKVQMFGDCFDAEFTLTDRSKMRHAILLGRKLLSGRFLVDVNKVYLSKKIG